MAYHGQPKGTHCNQNQFVEWLHYAALIHLQQRSLLALAWVRAIKRVTLGVWRAEVLRGLDLFCCGSDLGSGGASSASDTSESAAPLSNSGSSAPESAPEASESSECPSGSSSTSCLRRFRDPAWKCFYPCLPCYQHAALHMLPDARIPQTASSTPLHALLPARLLCAHSLSG